MKNPDDPYDDDEMTVQELKLPERHARSPNRLDASEELDPDKSEITFEPDQELLADLKFKQDFGSHGDEIKKAVGLLKETKPEQKKLPIQSKKSEKSLEPEYSLEDYQKYFKDN